MIEFCKYYRITELQYITLSESRNELQYALNLESLGILKQWKKQAKKAIEILEGLTNKTFLVDSPKSQYKRPTAEEVIQEQEREKAGYYTPEAEEGRKQAKKQAIIEQMKATANKKINEITEELSIMLQVFEIGGEKAANNCIFYTHTKTLAFNWKSYNMIPESEVNKIMSELKLPEGVKVINKYGK
jgi:phage repressor protein C with HTH and peptisase S24 domain